MKFNFIFFLLLAPSLLMAVESGVGNSKKSRRNRLKITQYFKTGTKSDETMEGTADTRNGCTLGTGAYNNCLIPCFCVAVDRRHHKLKSFVHIPALAGAKCRVGSNPKLMELDDSREFKDNVIVDYSEGIENGVATNINGVFRACDTGGAIKGSQKAFLF
jgi:3D (Asp-Asp-Asp) domain-containing protein